jgi:aminopeptidase N
MELDEIYDAITYEKSNSVIRMLMEHVGEPVFRRGLGAYLQRFQYANADSQDLWLALSEASGQARAVYFQLKKLIEFYFLKRI